MVGFIFIALSLLGVFYTSNSYADLIVAPWTSHASTSFLSGSVTILISIIIIGVIILLGITCFMRKKNRLYRNSCGSQDQASTSRTTTIPVDPPNKDLS